MTGGGYNAAMTYPGLMQHHSPSYAAVGIGHGVPGGAGTKMYASQAMRFGALGGLVPQGGSGGGLDVTKYLNTSAQHGQTPF